MAGEVKNLNPRLSNTGGMKRQCLFINDQCCQMVAIWLHGMKEYVMLGGNVDIIFVWCVILLFRLFVWEKMDEILCFGN